jgi:hypothetical protein
LHLRAVIFSNRGAAVRRKWQAAAAKAIAGLLPNKCHSLLFIRWLALNPFCILIKQQTMKPHFHFDQVETDILEMEPMIEIQDFEKEPVVAIMHQCGELCPQNNDHHRGACYLDFGHGGYHKCSVDGHEW